MERGKKWKGNFKKRKKEKKRKEKKGQISGGID
jgi:hypothetical protein